MTSLNLLFLLFIYETISLIEPTTNYLQSFAEYFLDCDCENATCVSSLQLAVAFLASFGSVLTINILIGKIRPLLPE